MDARDTRTLPARLLEHLRNGTTDQADDVYRVPVDAYRDPERWAREMDAIFRRSPVVVALTAHLPQTGSYRALDAAGIPVLSVRQSDGSVRVFLNACRHRGSHVCDPGMGKTRRFTCPYHSWSYDVSGRLAALPGAKNFGELDLSTLGLTELASEERAGMVFAVLTPGVALDLDSWLGSYGEVLETLGLANMHYYEERVLVSPNWKVAYDGYIDAYHLDKLHKETFGPTFIGDVMTADAWGPHQRMGFPTRSLASFEGSPDQLEGFSHIGVVHTVFPHVSIAGAAGIPTMVSQLFPGPTPDRSRTIQTHVTPAPVDTDEGRATMDGLVEFLEGVVRDEDYKTGLGIQAALASDANTEFVFGRNEACNQTFHRWVDKLAGSTQA
jgi:phenylpropionate dioxygenase-like ring-hydroxylating dioxygenase large terminal subunit